MDTQYQDQDQDQTIVTVAKVKFEDCPDVSGLIKVNISTETWREYTHGDRTFRIWDPVALYYRHGGSTHRIVDANGITHCHPVPGNGVGLSWCSPGTYVVR